MRERQRISRQLKICLVHEPRSGDRYAFHCREHDRVVDIFHHVSCEHANLIALIFSKVAKSLDVNVVAA